MRLFKTVKLCAVLLVLGSVAACNAQSGEADAAAAPAQKFSEAGLLEAPLTIQSGGKIYNFTVEVAQTQQQQAQGMMFRTKLAPDKGMIFPFSEDRAASFWMKNCVISLDMIFVRRDGTIESIAADRAPYSLESTRSGEPVAAVLELAGGRAAELSLKPGDRVSWKE